MSQPSPAIMARLRGPTLHLTRLFKIVCEDGTVFRWADFDSVVPFNGEEYSPIGGMIATASSRQMGLAERNQDFLGVLSSSGVEDADMQRAKFSNARVWCYVVDHERPEIGAILEDSFFITNQGWNDTSWKAKTVGMTRVLALRAGAKASRTCGNDFGDAYGLASVAGCKANVASLVQSAKAVATVTSRVVFTVENTLTGSPGDDYFAHGKVVWLTGNNAGLTSFVARFTASTRTITLSLPVDADAPIEVGDTFDLYPGCDKTQNRCGIYGQIENFHGSPYITGNDQSIQGVG